MPTATFAARATPPALHVIDNPVDWDAVAAAILAVADENTTTTLDEDEALVALYLLSTV